MKSKLLFLFLIFSSLTYHVHAQIVSIKKSNGKIITNIICQEIERKDTVSKYDDAVFTLTGDTLFSNKNFKIFKGQKLIVGNGSSDNGWYTNITLNSVLDWFSITLAVLGTENTETQEEKEFRINNTVRDCLHKEGTLYVKEIRKNVNFQGGYKYVVILKSRPGKPNTNYRCNLLEALKTGEIVIPIE